MNRRDAADLIVRYRKGHCTEQERLLVEAFYNRYGQKDPFDLEHEEFSEEMQRLSSTVLLNTGVPSRRGYRRWWLGRAAAMLMFAMLAIGIWFFAQQTGKENPAEADRAELSDAVPGRNRGILKLADGTKVDLETANMGQIAMESGTRILKSADGVLTYEVVGGAGTDPAGLYHTIEIPRGGKYQLRLPDGSTVWLNAASTLRYPLSFKGTKERKVELSGEGYFSIHHNAEQVFIVKTSEQAVIVLGTEFNVRTYAEERQTVTTLIEGSLKISAEQTTLLKPGQESITTEGSTRVQTADTEAAVGWKNDMFLFYNKDLPSIMREIERWYNVEVDIANIPNEPIYAEISRSVKLKQVLRLLEASANIRFKVQGRRITLEK